MVRVRKHRRGDKCDVEVCVERAILEWTHAEDPTDDIWDWCPMCAKHALAQAQKLAKALGYKLVKVEEDGA